MRSLPTHEWGHRYPIYVISKGRAAYPYTIRVLQRMGAEFRVVVEEQEVNEYAAVVGRKCLLILDPAYKRNYDTCDSKGLSLPPGSGPARNFVWDHAASTGARRHWLLDDNISYFTVWLNRRHRRIWTDTFFRVMEDYVDQFSNVYLAGPIYESFRVNMREQKGEIRKIALNTKVYSTILIDTMAPFRWRARYNEDTDLCLRVLKSGACTIQFNVFSQRKLKTQRLPGGNTDTIYVPVGDRSKRLRQGYVKGATIPKTRMLCALHPDVARAVFRYGREHHHVDYTRFRRNKLRVRPGCDPATFRFDRYPLKLVDNPDAIRRPRVV